jgi:hypothetical protein
MASARLRQLCHVGRDPPRLVTVSIFAVVRRLPFDAEPKLLNIVP